MVVLKRSRCLANDMDYALTFTQATHDAIEGAEFSNAVSRDKDTGNAFCTSVAIGGISRVKLVSIAYQV